MKFLLVLTNLALLGATVASDFSNAESALRQALLSDYNKNVRPESQVTYNLSMSLMSVNSFCKRSRTVELTAYAKFEWTDSRLAWNPESFFGIGSMEVSVNDIWVPDAAIFSGLPTNWKQQWSNYPALLLASGGILLIPHVQNKILCNSTIWNVDDDGVCTCGFSIGPWVHDSTSQRITETNMIGNDTSNLQWFQENDKYQVQSFTGTDACKYFEGLPDMCFSVVDYELKIKPIAQMGMEHHKNSESKHSKMSKKGCNCKMCQKMRLKLQLGDGSNSSSSEDEEDE